MKTILDPSFRYTTSFNTDLKKTFARIRRSQRQDTQKVAPARSVNLVNLSSVARKAADR